MEETMRKALLAHLQGYIKSYTDRHVTIEAALLNYVREFPARLHLMILALLEERKP